MRLKSFFCHSTGTDTEYRQVFSMRRWRRSASRPSRVCLSIQLKAQWFSSRSRSRTASCEVPLPREFAQDFQGSRLLCFESHTMLICSSQIRSAYSRAASRHRARSLPRYFFVLFKTDFRTAPEAPVGQRSLIRRLRLPSIRAILAMRDGCAYAVTKLTIGCNWAVTDYSVSGVGTAVSLCQRVITLSFTPPVDGRIAERQYSFSAFDDRGRGHITPKVRGVIGYVVCHRLYC